MGIFFNKFSNTLSFYRGDETIISNRQIEPENYHEVFMEVDNYYDTLTKGDKFSTLDVAYVLFAGGLSIKVITVQYSRQSMLNVLNVELSNYVNSIYEQFYHFNPNYDFIAFLLPNIIADNLFIIRYIYLGIYQIYIRYKNGGRKMINRKNSILFSTKEASLRQLNISQINDLIPSRVMIIFQ